MRDICTKIVDGDHNPPAGVKQPTDYLMLSATNINNDTLVDLTKVRYVTQDVFEIENQRTRVEINDIFFTIVGSMGRSCVYKGGYNLCFQRSVSVITTLVTPEFLKYILDTPYIQFFMYINATGTAQKGFYLKQVENLLIPLPPLLEQRRIVAKIEAILPYIDRYAEAYQKLEQFNAKFPEDMKKSILQYAIQGKLVEQRPEEGTGEALYQEIQAEKQRLIKEGKIKKEKPLAAIGEDEIPFDVPESWKWVRLGDIVRKPIKRGKSPTYTQQSGTLVFAQKCNTKAGYINLDIALFLDEQKLSKYPNEEFMQDYDIVINSTGNGTLGRVGMYRDSDTPRQLLVVPDSHVTVIRTIQAIDVEYVYCVLKYYQPYMEKLGTGSTNQTELNANTVRALLFPLPPLLEQRRIVAKIEELLPLCDRLK